jgi:branched-chain amino acid transport system ATP-binding protein
MKRSERPGVLASLGPYGLLPLAVLFGLNVVDEFDRVAFGALAPEIRNAFHLSNAALTSITALSGGLSILLSVPIGYLADRTNRVMLSRIAALVWAGAAVLVGAAPMLWMLVAARFVGGVGRLVNEPVHPSLLSDYYPPAVLPRVFGIHRFANNVGQLAGPIAGVLVGVLAGFRPVFIVLALPTILLVLLSFGLREPQRGTSEAAVHPDDQRVPFGEAFRRLRATHSLRRTWVAAFFFGSGVLPFTAILSLFFDDIYGVGPFGRGMIVAVFGAGGAVGLVIGSRLSNEVIKRGRPDLLPWLTGGMIVHFGVGVLVLGLTPWLIGGTVVAFVTAVGASGFLPSYLTMVALVTPARLRAQAFSYSLLFYAIGGIALSRIATSVGDDHGLRIGLVLLSVFVTAGGVAALTVKRFVRRDMDEATKSAGAHALAGSDSLLVCRGVQVAYDQVQVLFGVDLDVPRGEILAILGANGAGKTTLLKAIAGLVDPSGGAIVFDGRDITHADANATARRGIVMVPGGRGIFPGLTVAENLRTAGWLDRGDPEHRRHAVDRVLQMFPILRERINTLGGSLSGGEQQMLSLAQAFVSKPRLLMIDELSLGLAPTIVDRLLEVVRAMHEGGATIVLVEQSVNTALQLAQRAVFMEKGEIRFAGPTAELLERPDVLRAVFLQGAAAAGAEPNGRRRAALAERRPAPGPDAPVVLSTRGLSKHFGGVVAVDDVDLDLRQGEILGLIGPNGAGKTTVFDLMSGFIPADRGTVVLHGRDATSWPAASRAWAGLGRVFQDAKLFPSLTVREAIAASLERHVFARGALPAVFAVRAVRESEAAAAERVEELLSLLGLRVFRDKFVSELSTGSRRMVELAAVLAQSPSIVILDEPSSGIAQRESEALGPLLRDVQLQTGSSMLVIEHDMPLITGLADRLIALDQGRVVASGTPAEVTSHPIVIESYLGSMAHQLAGAGVSARRPRRSSSGARGTRSSGG